MSNQQCHPEERGISVQQGLTIAGLDFRLRNKSKSRDLHFARRQKPLCSELQVPLRHYKNHFDHLLIVYFLLDEFYSSRKYHHHHATDQRHLL